MTNQFEIKYLMRESMRRFMVEVKITDPDLSHLPKEMRYFWVWIEDDKLTPLTFVEMKSTGQLQQRTFKEGFLEFSASIATYERVDQDVVYMVVEPVSAQLPMFAQALLKKFVESKLPELKDWTEQAGIDHIRTEEPSKIVNEITIEPALQGSLSNAGVKVLQVDDGKQALKLNTLLAAAGVASGVDMSLESLVPRKYLRPAKHYDPKFDAKKAEEQKAWNELKDQERKALKDFKKSVPRSERVFPKKK